MNKLLRAGFAVALCVSAAACADKPAPVVEAAAPPPPPPAPVVVTAFDGVYHGQYTRAAGSAKSCHASHKGTITVTNGMFSTAVSKGQSFQGVQVGQDGAFNATAGDSTFQGAIADRKLSGKLDGANCHYTVTMIARAPKAARS